jgi:hypothetical protein
MQQRGFRFCLLEDFTGYELGCEAKRVRVDIAIPVAMIAWRSVLLDGFKATFIR